MKSCNWMNRRLSAYVSGELSPEAEKMAAQHLLNCPHCRQKVAEMKQILQEARALKAEGDAALVGIDWDAVETRIFSAGSGKQGKKREFSLLTALLQGAMAACLLFPVLFFTLHNIPEVPAPSGVRLSGTTLDRMETNVARDEVRQVLSQSRLLLSQFMEQCPGQNEGPFSWQSGKDVRKLMAKNRILRKDLDRARLQNARGLCRKLDMVFSEMAAVSPRDGCRDVTRLQKLLKREHIFLKIRLVEEELKRSGGEA